MIRKERYALEEVLELVIDHRGKTPTKLKGRWSNEGIPALSAKNIKAGTIVNEESIRFVDNDLYERWMPVKLEAGDVLLTSEAPLGELFYLKLKADYCLSQRLFGLRAKKRLLYPRFLYYNLMTREMQSRIGARATGTTAQGIRQKELMKVLIEIPSYKTQKSIVSVLSAYDDLIENNNRRIKILEQMAQTIYDEWFVKFHFPGHGKVKMVNSELGKIPEGWEVKRLGDVTHNFDSKRIPLSSLKRKEMQGIYPYYGAAKILDYVNDYIFDGRYLLMAEDGSVITKDNTPVLQLVDEKFWVNNHTHVLQGKAPISTEFLYLMLSRFKILGYITGAAQPKITQNNLNRIPVLEPTEGILEKFDKIIKDVLHQRDILLKKNGVLQQTRDILLPKLISGEIDVEKMDIDIGDVDDR